MPWPPEAVSPCIVCACGREENVDDEAACVDALEACPLTWVVVDVRVRVDGARGANLREVRRVNLSLKVPR